MGMVKREKFRMIGMVSAAIVLAAVGFTIWFAYNSSQMADKTLQSANKVSKDIPKLPSVDSFEACKKSPGSKMLLTYPEQCVTTTGKKFTDPNGLSMQTPKAAADSVAPAAGTCPTTAGTVVTVTLTEGIPSPRCSQVTAKQTLSVVNPTTKTVTVTLGSQSATIAAGKTGVILVPFGDYLKTGDHIMKTGLYGTSGPEIYLPAN